MVHEYPSFVAGLRYKGRDGFDRARYCARHLRVGERLLLHEEPDNPVDDEATTISPAKAPHLIVGYIPAKHHWVHRALDEGAVIDAVVETVECDGWFFRRAWRVWIMVRVDHDQVIAHRTSAKHRTIGEATG